MLGLEKITECQYSPNSAKNKGEDKNRRARNFGDSRHFDERRKFALLAHVLLILACAGISLKLLAAGEIGLLAVYLCSITRH